MGEATVLRVFRFLSDRHSVVVYRRRWPSDKYCAGEFTDTCLRKWRQFSGRNVGLCWPDSSAGNGSVCGT